MARFYARYNEATTYAREWFSISVDAEDIGIEIIDRFAGEVFSLIRDRVNNKDLNDVGDLVDLYYDLQQASIEASRAAEKKKIVEETEEVQDE